MDLQPGLFTKAQAKDEDALRRIYELYKHDLYAYFFRRSFSRDECDEVFSFTMEKLVLNIHRIASVRFVRPYMFRIARNRLIDLARKRARTAATVSLDHIELDFTTDQKAKTPDQVFEEKEQIVLLRSAMARLPVWELSAIQLFYDHDKPVQEIASKLGKTEKAVESLLYRGKKRLKTLMERERKAAEG